MLLDPELVALAARVVHENARTGRLVSSAESCTGGLVAAAITEIAGASAILGAAFITYSNAAKHAVLGVPEATLAAHGAVSVETAEAMAIGALRASGADVAVAISGIAGPGGGTAAKPVGTVAFGCAINNGSEVVVSSQLHHFDRNLDRTGIRRLAGLEALRLLLP